MHRSRTLAVGAAFAAAAVLATAACGSGSSSSGTSGSSGTGAQAAANAQLCSAVTNFKSAIKAMTDLGGTPSISSLATATGNVATAWSQLQAASQNASGVDTTSLGNAVNTFESTMQSLPSKGFSATDMSAAATAAKQAVQPLAATVKGLAPACGS